MNRKTIGFAVLLAMPALALLAGCPVVLPGLGGLSDVPCLRPTAWPEGSSGYLVRMEAPELLLIAHRTSEQAVEDIRDLIAGNDGHGPVYRFDVLAETFDLVDDDVWSEAVGMAIGCTGQQARDSPFGLLRSGTQRVLLFNDQEVTVVGGNAVSVWDVRGHDAVAVVSAEAGGGIPFLSSVSSSGQHYHQLYSEVDGQPTGDSVRLPFSGTPNPPEGCWFPDGGFMLYSESSDGRFDRICIVDVRDLVPQTDPGDDPGEENGDAPVSERP